MGKIDEKEENLNYIFKKIPKKDRQKIFDILNSCKEIRNTSYPLKNSSESQAEIIEFTATKNDGIVRINGKIKLNSKEQSEERWIDASIINNLDEIRVFLDVTRVTEEPKIIRTIETFNETKNKVKAIIKYNASDLYEEKIFEEEFEKNKKNYLEEGKKSIQLSAL